jgi:orotate phosphoribosyltransferase
MGVTAILLDKPILDGKVNYRPTKHSGGIKQLYLLTSGTELRIMLVDDVVSSGLSMGHAIAEIQRGFVTSTIVAAVSGNGWYNSIGKLMKDKVPGIRLFSSCGKYGSLREFEIGKPINI